MKAITIANKLVSISRILVVSVLITLPLNAQAEYYLVYGPPAVPVVCDSCQTRHYYRPVHKTYKAKKCKTAHKKYYRSAHRRSHYSITVYYPVPVSSPSCYSCCSSCGLCNRPITGRLHLMKCITQVPMIE